MIERRDDELSRIYRDAEGPRPPQRVDDNILAASQRVAGARRRPAGFGFARRWGTPVALAATVLVTFTLALMVFERESGLDAMAPEARRTDRPAKILPAEPQRADQPGTPSPLVLRPIAPAPPISQALQRDPVGQGPGESTVSMGGLGTGQPAFVPEVPRASEVLRKREEAKPALAAPVPDAQSAPELRQQARPMQAPAAAPAAGALSESGATLQGSGVTAAIASPLAVSEAKERTPEKWLEDIRKLRTEGRMTEVERELTEFRKRYPDYILPEDLR
jgi:resuscitation-promoting factor RpfA